MYSIRSVGLYANNKLTTKGLAVSLLHVFFSLQTSNHTRTYSSRFCFKSLFLLFLCCCSCVYFIPFFNFLQAVYSSFVYSILICIFRPFCFTHRIKITVYRFLKQIIFDIYAKFASFYVQWYALHSLRDLLASNQSTILPGN